MNCNQQDATAAVSTSIVRSIGHQQGSRRHSFFTKNTNSNKEINIHIGDPTARLTSFHASQSPQQGKTYSRRQQKQRPSPQTNGVAMLHQPNQHHPL
ncbi:hypothetical protein Nepgr_020383 [Nepenthes gracilis]|uniref:Uncharacterized protein n=1 Tax=Nepenthes gracilis TaxID=150966 RepID=A0AAD3SY15_NEPGR|nr:hypothetical protein Nepgr_020383 [Nepenthes gracilis]